MKPYATKRKGRNMRSKITATKSQYRFNSLAQYARWLRDTAAVWKYTNSREHKGEQDWDFATGYEKCEALARDGWLEGAQKAQDALKAFSPTSPAPDTKTDFYGHRPHVARYCSGAPDSMIRYDRDAQNGSGRVMSLLVPISVNYMTQAEYFANFGVGVAQYVNQMEAQGYRVEVHAGMAQESKGHRMTCTVQIKSADQPLDLAVMAFAIGHPAMFRRLGFAMIERSVQPQSPGYGMPCDMKAQDMLDAPLGLIVLNGATSSNHLATTPQRALKYIEGCIEAAMQEQYQ